MKYFIFDKRSQLERLIKKHVGQYEFIAFILSSWHLDIFYSWYISNSHERGAIIVIPQSDIDNESKYRLDKDNFTDKIEMSVDVVFMKKYDFKISAMKSIRTILLMHKVFNSKKTVLLNPGGINLEILLNLPFDLIHNIEYIMLDEGTSTYFGPGRKGLLKNAPQKWEILLLVNLGISHIKTFLKNIVTKNIINVQSQQYYLFEINESSLRINTEVSFALKRYYDGCYNIKNTFLVHKRHTVLIIKDLDYEIISEHSMLDMYIKIIKKVREFIPECEIIIRKHPNDIYQMLDDKISMFNDIHINQSKDSVESLLYTINPSVILGGISTASFNIPAIFKKTVITYMNLYKKYRDINTLYYDRINSLNVLFENTSEYLIFIDDFDDLNQSKLLVQKRN